jgi:hypothetical protein
MASSTIGCHNIDEKTAEGNVNKHFNQLISHVKFDYIKIINVSPFW